MRKVLFAPAALAALVLAVPAHAGFIINATFDSNVTVAEKAVINQALGVYESLFSNNITVSIYYQGMTSCLGQSNYDIYSGNYSSFYSDLVATNANPTAIADLTANGGSGADNPVTGNTSIQLKSANARAVGMNISPGCQLTGSSGSEACGGSSGPAYDGVISVNMGITNPPGSSGSNYSLLAVIEHETDEVLGLGSALENVNTSTGTENASNDTYFNAPAPEDLWRFAANGTTRSFSSNCASPAAAYFFLNASTDVTQFNNACNGGDFGDWAGGSTPQVQDWQGTPGSSPTLGASEIDALTAIGYTLSAPEPATWILMLGSLSGLALLKRFAA